MHLRDLKVVPTVVIAIAGVVVGLAVPAAAQETRHLISGSDIAPNSVTGKQVKESTLGTVPRATEARTLPPLVWHTFALKDGWKVDGIAPAYAIDAQGIAFLRGQLSGGVDDTLAFTLPKSLRPTNDLIIVVPEGTNKTGQLEIVTDGNVFVEDDPDHPGSSTLTGLDGVVLPPQ